MVTEATSQPRKRIGCLKKRDGTAATFSDSENEETDLFSKNSLGFGPFGRSLVSDSEEDLVSSPGTLKPSPGNLLSGNGRLDTNLFKEKTSLGFGLNKSLLTLTDSESDSELEKELPSNTNHKYGEKDGLSKETRTNQKPGKAARILEMLGYESDEEETTQRKDGDCELPMLKKLPISEPNSKLNAEVTNASSSSSESSSEDEGEHLKPTIKTPRKTKNGLKSATKRDLLEMHKETERLIRQSALAAPTRIPKTTQKRLDMSAFLKKFQKSESEAVDHVERESEETSKVESMNKKSSPIVLEAASMEQINNKHQVNTSDQTLPSKVKVTNSLTEFLTKSAEKPDIVIDKGKQVEGQGASTDSNSINQKLKHSADHNKLPDEKHLTSSELTDPFITNQSSIVTASYQDSDSDLELEIIENPKDLAIQGLLKVVQKKPRNSPIKPVSHPNTAALTSPSRIRSNSVVTQKQLNRQLLNTIQSQSAKKRIKDIERQLAKQYTPDKVAPEILSDEEGILLSGEDEEENQSLSESEMKGLDEESHNEEVTITNNIDEEISNIMQQNNVEENNTTDDEMPLPSSLRPRHKASSIFNRVLSDDEDEQNSSIESTIPTQPHLNEPSHQMDEEGFMLSSLPKSKDSQEENDAPTQYINEDGLLTLNAPTQETIPCTPSQDSISTTQIVNSSLTSISQSPPHTWSRLQQGRPAESTSESSKPMTEMDAFTLLGQAALNEFHKTSEASMVTQLKPKSRIQSEFIDAEAEEEEDEFGIGIGVDDEEDEESEEDIMIPTLDEDEEFDHQDVKQLHLQQMKEKDRKDITNLMNDIATGGLRKRRRLGFDDGKGYDLDEEFSDEESLNRRSRFRLIKRRTNTDDFLDRIAQNPETAAFARAIADDGMDVEDPFDHVVDNAEDVFSMFRSNHSVSVEEIYSREMSMEVEEIDDTVEEVNEDALHISEAKIYYNLDTTTATTTVGTTTKSVAFDFSKSDDFEGRDQSILRLIKNRNSAPASADDPNDDSAYEPWMNTHRSGVSFLETNPDRAKRFISAANEDKILGEVVARKEFNQKNMAFRSASKPNFVTSKPPQSKGKAPERPMIGKLSKSCGSSAIESLANLPSQAPQHPPSEKLTDPCPLLKVLSKYDSFQ